LKTFFFVELPSTKEEPDGLTYETAELPELQYEVCVWFSP